MKLFGTIATTICSICETKKKGREKHCDSPVITSFYYFIAFTAINFKPKQLESFENVHKYYSLGFSLLCRFFYFVLFFICRVKVISICKIES